MSSAVSSVSGVSSPSVGGAFADKGSAPASPEASSQAASMPGRNSVQGGKIVKAHESEFAQMAHLGDEARVAKYGSAFGGGAKENAAAADSSKNTDATSNPATAAAHAGIQKAFSSAHRIHEV